ncbi:MAG: hypothetical protein Q4B57_05170 [Eubacteriales bacterium]|nr:hypothetical protein [Eubacteriales bacterium]
MKTSFAETHVCYAILRGKTGRNLFETEIRKKWILDTVAQQKNISGCTILAYCVLDNEVDLILCASDIRQIESCLEKTMARYLAEYPVCSGRREMWRKLQVTELENERRVFRYCIKIHLLPLVQQLADDPEDYWWCSYRDYLGKPGIALAETKLLMTGIDVGKRAAVRSFRRSHREKIDRLCSTSIDTKRN